MKRRSILDLERKPSKYRAVVTRYKDHAELVFYGLPNSAEPLIIRSPKAIGAYNKCMKKIRPQYGIDRPMVDWTWQDADGNAMKWGCE